MKHGRGESSVSGLAALWFLVAGVLFAHVLSAGRDAVGQEAENLTLSGRVLDIDSGAPAAGAIVEASLDPAGVARLNRFLPFGRQEYSAEVNAEGSFVFSGLVPGSYWVRVAGNTAYVRVSNEDVRKAEVWPGAAPRDLVLRVSQAGSLVGNIVDPAGEAVVGAVISAGLSSSDLLLTNSASDPGETLQPARTTEQGDFILRGLVPSSPYDVLVASNNHPPLWIPGVRVEASKRQVDIGTVALESGSAVGGLLLEADGSPAAAVPMRLVPNPPTEELWLWVKLEMRTTTDKDGRFLFARVGSGQYRVHAARRDRGVYRPGWLVGGEIDVRAGEPIEGLTLRLAPRTESGRISGAVLDKKGTPLVGVPVEVVDWSTLFMATVDTDEEGRFAIAVESPGPFQLTAMGGFLSMTTSEIDDVRPGQEGLVVTLDHANALVSGRVTIAESPVEESVPHSYTYVWWRRLPGQEEADNLLNFLGDSATSSWVRADEGGGFTLQVAPGLIQILARSGGFATARTAPFLVEAGSHKRDVRVTLSKGASVRGVVQAANGNGLEGVVVRLLRRPPDAFSRLRGRLQPLEIHGTNGEAATDASGEFHCEFLEPGHYTLLASRHGLPPQLLSDFVLSEGQELEVPPIVLGPGSEVRVFLTAIEKEHKRPVPAIVKLIGPAPERRARTSAEGSVIFENVTAGEWLLVCSEADGPRVGERVIGLTVKPGAPTQLNIDLTAGFSVAGSVDGVGEKKLHVTARRSETRSPEQTDLDDWDERFEAARALVARVPIQDGKYQIAGLEAGRYLIEILQPGTDPLDFQSPVAVGLVPYSRTEIEVRDRDQTVNLKVD